MKGPMRRPAIAALTLAAACALNPAHAEQAVDKTERIEVTGTRLASSDADSASPIAVIKAEDIKLEGYQHLELMLNNYPQIFGDQGNRINNGATGGATVSLRNLGASRTLTLLNGRRLPAGSPYLLAPDINQIPPALIQRIEILTGGASAVYGSDAIAGVVNFILNDRFEGVQGEVSYDFYNHQQGHALMQWLLRTRSYPIPGDVSHDGATTAVSLTLGGNFAQDKGNATVSFRYLNTDPIMQSARDYGACAIVEFGVDALACGGSDTGFAGRFQDLTGPRLPNGRRPAWTLDLGNGAVRPYVQPGDQYNYAPLNYFQRPAERYGFNAFLNYDVTPNARVYAEFGFHDDNSVFQLAPSGVFSAEVLLPYENPLLSEDWRRSLVFRHPDGSVGTGPGTFADIVLQRRNVEGGGRLGDMRHTSFREVIGLKGTAARDWDYDVYFQTSAVRATIFSTADFSNTRIRRALDVVSDPSTGRAVCASALDRTDPACVPYNLWSLAGVTPEARAYLEIPALERASMSQQIAGGTMTTDLGRYGVRSPRARAGVEVAFGVERRSERLDYEPDASKMAGDLAGNTEPSLPVRGAIVTRDLFGEVRVPILDSLNLSGSYRRSDPGGNKKTDTYGIGFNAEPFKSLRVRGSYQRAARNPDLNELFTPQTTGIAETDDPCAGPVPDAPFVQCQRTGVTAAQYGNIEPAPIVNNAINGGNENLISEKGTTYTVGIVLSPMRNLTFTVDYWNIRLDDAIATVGADLTMRQCLATGDPKYCAFIHRDPVLGTLWMPGGYIIDINQNVGTARLAGVDISGSYALKLRGGHGVLVDGIGSYMQMATLEAPGTPAVECAGRLGSDCGTPTPKWRHRLRTTWQTPWDLDVAATWRYTSEVKHLRDDAYTPILKAASYLDLAASWNITKRLTLRAGVNNVLDEDPPLTLASSTNVAGLYYDILGRHVFVSLTARF